MKINRNSWHYKARKKCFDYFGWVNILESDVTLSEYITDVIFSLVYLPIILLKKKRKRKYLEFE
jgi:hypothetical protein